MFAQTNATFEQAKTERKASYTRRLVDIVVSNDRTPNAFHCISSRFTGYSIKPD